MNNNSRKQLVKLLTEKKKKLKDKNIQIEKPTIIKKPIVDEKYVSECDYKELVALYELIKEMPNLSNYELENIIEQNHNSFPYLTKCLNSMYDFITELRCGGPYSIAREMARQGKELDHINNHIFKSDK